MLSWMANHLYACGKEGLPKEINCLGSRYGLEKVLKHDFFAATGLYRAIEGPNPECGEKVILKFGRRHHFLYIPMSWMGWLVSHHEYCTLVRLKDVERIPKILGRYKRTGFFYRYIEGCSLDEKPKLPKDFFEKLRGTLEQIHSRGVVYFDLNKRGNILLGDDGLPYLIDFQISVMVPSRLFLFKGLTRRFLQSLQKADIYHLYKHKRKLQPEELTPEEEKLSRHVSLLIRVHRAIAHPFRLTRRAFLKYMYRKGHLKRMENTHYSRETDPARFVDQ